MWEAPTYQIFPVRLVEDFEFNKELISGHNLYAVTGSSFKWEVLDILFLEEAKQ